MRKVYLLVILFTLSCEAFTQSNNSSEVYYNFLKEIQNLDYSGSSALYPLQQNYYQAVPEPEHLNSFVFYDSVCIKLNLNVAEKEMLAKNGFVVTERLSYEKFLLALREIYFLDLPVMITSDMMLFALHASYDAILKSLEIDILRPNLIEMLENMRISFDLLYDKYEVYPELINSLKDIDIYISIPLGLLGKANSPIIEENQETYQLLISKIAAENGFESMPLFSEHLRILDFSQFKPRGHYTEEFITPYGNDSLTAYFRAMIWLGRMDFLLTPPPSIGDVPWSEEDILRMNTSALLLDELLDVSDMRTKLEQNEKIIDLLVGMSDNLSPSELRNICTSVGTESASDLLDTVKYKLFKTRLVADPASEQRILSDIFMVDPFSSEPDPLPVSFRLLGQRFIIDSYFFSQLVYDRIIFEGEKVWRPLPSPLDVAFILGNNDALNLQQDEINTYKYATQISCLRKLTDLYDSTFWQQSLYNSWLSCLKQLNNKPGGENAPFFLSTAAWQHEKLNTQLASWAQLRHDNLLYAKQSYTGGVICSYPFTYIEPYPEFFKSLYTFAVQAGSFFDQLNANYGIILYFNRMRDICFEIMGILDNQIMGVPLTENQIKFLKDMYAYQDGGCGGPYDAGWYNDLLFDEGKEAVVADVHTQPTEFGGAVVGKVLHVGTGKVNLGVFLAKGPAPDNLPMAFVGPVMSYYETVTNNFYRYNDEEWQYVFPGLQRPDWTSIYLVSKNGTISESGRELPYELVKMPGSNIETFSGEEILLYPNPAGDNLTIGEYSSTAFIKIFDLQGRLVLQSLNNNNRIDLKTFDKGMYMIKIIDKGLQKTGKFIKE